MIYLFKDSESKNRGCEVGSGVLAERAIYQIMASNSREVFGNGGRLEDMIFPCCTIFLGRIIKEALSKNVVYKTWQVKNKYN